MAKAMVELNDEVRKVGETAKAVELQLWTGSGCDPEGNARTRWFPKSQVSFDGRVWSCARWLLTKNGLWHWTR